MSNFILGMLYLFGGNVGTIEFKEEYVPVCYRNIDNLTLDQKIEISMGCSLINGSFAYSEARLQRVWDGE